jgi:hypothetical protein
MTIEPSTTNSTELEVPKWVPDAVAAQAQALYRHVLAVPSATAERVAGAVKRLATDPRMRGVWSELLSRRGGQARRQDFVHPVGRTATLKHIDTNDAKSVLETLPESDRLQHEALVELFSDAANFFAWDWNGGGAGPFTRTKAEIDSEIADLKALAGRLRREADELRRLGGSSFAPQLESAARNCDLQAELGRAAPDNPFIVQRQSKRLGGPWVRGFIIQTAGHFTALFDKQMLGLVAIMANVGFESCDLTEDRLRGVFRRNPASSLDDAG